MPDSPPASPSLPVTGEGGNPSPASGGETPRRFQSWRGFLFAAIGVNVLYLWGMMGLTRDPAAAVWAKTLAWLPFNLIATVLYYVFIIKLSGTGGFAVRSLAGAFFVALCLAMITLNWLAFFAA
jgi:hypothetical protein